MSDPKTAIALTLIQEGGFQNNPNDHANWTGGQVGVGTLVGTKYGITCLDLPGISIKDLTPDQATQFAAGQWYVNVHTSAHPGGEIRGQVTPPKS